jgi:hypothetical protein
VLQAIALGSVLRKFSLLKIKLVFFQRSINLQFFSAPFTNPMSHHSDFVQDTNLTINDVRSLEMLLVSTRSHEVDLFLLKLLTSVTRGQTHAHLTVRDALYVPWIECFSLSYRLAPAARLLSSLEVSRASFKQLHKFCCDLTRYCAILCCGNTNFSLFVLC